MFLQPLSFPHSSTEPYIPLHSPKLSLQWIEITFISYKSFGLLYTGWSWLERNRTVDTTKAMEAPSHAAVLTIQTTFSEASVRFSDIIVVNNRTQNGKSHIRITFKCMTHVCCCFSNIILFLKYCDMTAERRNILLLGNGSVNTFPRKRKHSTIEERCFLWSAPFSLLRNGTVNTSMQQWINTQQQKTHCWDLVLHITCYPWRHFIWGFHLHQIGPCEWVLQE
jgi:hypothetical protein